MDGSTSYSFVSLSTYTPVILPPYNFAVWAGAGDEWMLLHPYNFAGLGTYTPVLLHPYHFAGLGWGWSCWGRLLYSPTVFQI